MLHLHYGVVHRYFVLYQSGTLSYAFGPRQPICDRIIFLLGNNDMGYTLNPTRTRTRHGYYPQVVLTPIALALSFSSPALSLSLSCR